MKRLSPYYTSYITSDLWREKRAKILMLAGYKCYKCGKRATQVHHLTYARLGHEWDSDLRAVCVKCHKRIEMWKSVWKFVKRLFR